MSSLIAYALLIPFLYNMFDFFTKRQKLAIKYNVVYNKEDGSTNNAGEEFKLEEKKLIIRFAIVDFVLLLFFVIIFLAS